MRSNFSYPANNAGAQVLVSITPTEYHVDTALTSGNNAAVLVDATHTMGFLGTAANRDFTGWY